MNSDRRRIIRNSVVSVTLLAMFHVAAAEKAPEVPFPDGYRSWQHVKSVVNGPGHKSFASEGGKIFQFYANPAAVEGYRAGSSRMDP